MGKVKWTFKSVNHLESIHEYIAKDSPIFAQRFITSLIKATDKLKSQPIVGSVVPEFEINTIRELLFKNFRIVYRVIDDNDIEILSVVHGSRDFSKIAIF